MTKPFYKSQTINAAIIGYLILVANTGLSLHNPDTGEWRAPNQAETAAILTGAGALYQTIEGRKKATEKIGNPMSDGQDFSFEPTFIESVPDNVDVEETKYIVAEDENDLTSVDFEESGELSIDLNTSGSYKIRILNDTVLKTSQEDSSTLSIGDQKFLEKGKVFEIESYKFLGKTNHIQVGFAGDSVEYFLYVPHIELTNNSEKVINLVDNSSPVKVVNPKKTPFRLPGFSSTFFLEDSVIPNGNFTWSEVTHGGTRLPSEKWQVENAINLCTQLQKLREFLGNRPMRITSFGRPEPINSQVGGAKNSYHTKFAACDFYIPGADMKSVEGQVEQFWLSKKIGGVGKAASAGRNFIHVDLGPVRTFPY
jgi:hypothetical protein